MHSEPRESFHAAVLAVASLAVAALAFVLMTKEALAIPSFARQTGMKCAACHTIYPEINAFGRQFKLRGFTLGTALDDKKFPLELPVAAVVVPSVNSTRSRENVEPEEIERDGKLSLQMAGIYYGGRIAGKLGALAQYNYDGIERKWGVEMIDVRYADSTTVPGNRELVWGITLNNNPTLADIYNSTPMWSFPHLTTEKTIMPAASLLDMTLFRQVGGVGLYGFWNNLVYGEMALYRTTKSGIMRPLGAGAERETIVDNYAPYWRLAIERTWERHTLAVGTLGLAARVFPDDDSHDGPTDRFRDFGVDAQYHFDTGDHLVSAHAISIREKQKWDASFPAGMASVASTRLSTARADVHYVYKRRYGFGIQRFSTRGDEDQLRYNMGEPVMSSVAGKPDTRGWQLELFYLPVEWAKLGVRYTAYQQFNGGKRDYDGFGRSAKDNNTIYAYAWILF